MNAVRDMQVAIVALEIALARYRQSLGLRPTLLIGHSLGEYAALCVAGVLSVAEAFTLVYERATRIITRYSLSEAGTLAVGLPVSTVRWHIRDLQVTTTICEVCCINGPASSVVGGLVAALDALDNYLKSDGDVATTRLRVQHVFPTGQMGPLLDDLEANASRISFQLCAMRRRETLRDGLPFVVSAMQARIAIRARHFEERGHEIDAGRVRPNLNDERLILDQPFRFVPKYCVAEGYWLASLSTEVARSKDFAFTWLQNLAEQRRCHRKRGRLSVAWGEFHKDHLDQVQLMSGLPTYVFDCQNLWL